MGQLTGIITAGLQLGLESILVRPSRRIGPFAAQVWLEETHTDELEISDHPVETGARITDHAFMRPSEVTIRCGWSNSPSGAAGAGGIGGLIEGAITGVLQTIPGLTSLLSGNDESSVKAVYQRLLALQAARVPFDVLTGKRAYNNMLIKSLRTTTDPDSENSLIITAVCRQIIIVKTQVVTVGAPASAQAAPQSTQPTADQGTKSLDPAPDVSKDAARVSINPIDGPPNLSPTPLPPLPPVAQPLADVQIPPGLTKDPQTGNLYGSNGIVDTSATIQYHNNGGF